MQHKQSAYKNTYIYTSEEWKQQKEKDTVKIKKEHSLSGVTFFTKGMQLELKCSQRQFQSYTLKCADISIQ